MNTVLLCRDGAAARYLAHEMARSGRLDAVVLESGKDARRRKLDREWARTPWWRVPLLALDLAALATYGKLWGRALDRVLRGHPASREYPSGVSIQRFDDANDPACVEALRVLAPEVLVVLGTSILRPDVLEIPTRAALNVHGGIVPQYRNVHSEFWAVLNDDAENVGTTILHLDEGIDSGAVALQGRVAESKGFFDLRWRNVQLSARLLLEALERQEEGSLPRDPQGSGPQGFYATPGIGALLRLAVKRKR